MAIRAIYENGSLRLLDPVDLKPGQQVNVTIEVPSDADNAQVTWKEAAANLIDRAFQETSPSPQIAPEEKDKRGDNSATSN